MSGPIKSTMFPGVIITRGLKGEPKKRGGFGGKLKPFGGQARRSAPTVAGNARPMYRRRMPGKATPVAHLFVKQKEKGEPRSGYTKLSNGQVVRGLRELNKGGAK